METEIALSYAVWLLAVAEKAGCSVTALIENAPEQIRPRLVEMWQELAPDEPAQV